MASSDSDSDSTGNLLERLCCHEEKFIESLNLDLVVDELDILFDDEDQEVLSMRTRTKNSKIRHLLNVVKRNGERGCERLRDALKTSAQMKLHALLVHGAVSVNVPERPDAPSDEDLRIRLRTLRIPLKAVEPMQVIGFMQTVHGFTSNTVTYQIVTNERLIKSRRALELMDSVSRHGEEAYVHLIKGLWKTGYEDLACQLADGFYQHPAEFFKEPTAKKQAKNESVKVPEPVQVHSYKEDTTIRKMLDCESPALTQVCCLLDKKGTQRKKTWASLLPLMDMDSDLTHADIEELMKMNKCDSPARQVLETWWERGGEAACLGRFLAILHEMKRQDLIDVLSGEMAKLWKPPVLETPPPAYSRRPDDTDLHEIAKALVEETTHLALLLEVEESTIARCKVDHRNDAMRAYTSMLQAWRSKVDGTDEYSFATIFQMLETMGRNDVIARLKKRL